MVSDWLRIRITADPGRAFLDRMIALVEGAVRQQTPNEIALVHPAGRPDDRLPAGRGTLQPFAIYAGGPVATVILVALLVCLIPTTIGGLLSAIGIAGMDRVTRFNVLAMSGRAVEAAGDVDTLLLDKTGTITFGNRLAAEFIPVAAPAPAELARRRPPVEPGRRDAEGRSILALAEQLGAPRPTAVPPSAPSSIPFTAETRMSGLRQDGHAYMKGAVDAILASLSVRTTGRPSSTDDVERISRAGGTPLAVAVDERVCSASST